MFLKSQNYFVLYSFFIFIYFVIVAIRQYDNFDNKNIKRMMTIFHAAAVIFLIFAVIYDYIDYKINLYHNVLKYYHLQIGLTKNFQQ